jgi:hypothetical protein
LLLAWLSPGWFDKRKCLTSDGRTIEDSDLNLT